VLTARLATARLAAPLIAIASVAVAAAGAVAVCVAAAVMALGTITVDVTVRAFAAAFEQAFLPGAGSTIATAATASAATPATTAASRALTALAVERALGTRRTAARAFTRNAACFAAGRYAGCTSDSACRCGARSDSTRNARPSGNRP
jgi:hypothetical protein